MENGGWVVIKNQLTNKNQGKSWQITTGTIGQGELGMGNQTWGELTVPV